jgi:hypothetical protein
VALAIVAVAAMETSGSGEDWGSAMVAAELAFLGGVLGAIAGFVGSLCWISQRGCEPWPVPTWIGMLVGLMFVLVVRFSGALNFCVLGMLIQSWLGLAMFLAAAACVGGFVGSAARGKSKGCS